MMFYIPLRGYFDLSQLKKSFENSRIHHYRLFSKTGSLKKAVFKARTFSSSIDQELTMEYNEGNSCGNHVRKSKIRNEQY